MTPDPLNDPIINYGWRRCEKEPCINGDQWVRGDGRWATLHMPGEPCQGNHSYPVRRRIQPPEGMELIGLDEDMVDGSAALFTDGEKGFWRHPRDFKRYTAREIVLKRSAASDVAVAAFFRPIKIMSEPKEYYRATQSTRSGELIGYFEGERKHVEEFLFECEHYNFVVAGVTWNSITAETVEKLKAAKKTLNEATAALKAIKV